MQRYAILVTAPRGQTKPRSRTFWSHDDDGAIEFAKQWLAMLHRVSPSARHLTEWEVYQGNPPYTLHKTVATGRIEP